MATVLTVDGQTITPIHTGHILVLGISSPIRLQLVLQIKGSQQEVQVEPSSPAQQPSKDLLIFFAAQIARIHTKLYPQTIHSSGPRRPDLADQEDQKLR